MLSESQLEERCDSSEIALVCHDPVPITISCFVSSDKTLSGRSGCMESATPTNWRPGVLRNLATDEAMTQCPEALGKLVRGVVGQCGSMLCGSFCVTCVVLQLTVAIVALGFCNGAGLWSCWVCSALKCADGFDVDGARRRPYCGVSQRQAAFRLTDELCGSVRLSLRLSKETVLARGNVVLVVPVVHVSLDVEVPQTQWSISSGEKQCSDGGAQRDGCHCVRCSSDNGRTLWCFSSTVLGMQSIFPCVAEALFESEDSMHRTLLQSARSLHSGAGS